MENYENSPKFVFLKKKKAQMCMFALYKSGSNTTEKVKDCLK